jgi:AcrR family transcriptional regulator
MQPPPPVAVRPPFARAEPQQQRARLRREAILAATMRLLLEQDPGDITTTLIARRAGVPVGSIYQYFPNKSAILRALAEDAMERVDRQLLELMASAGEGGLDGLIEATIDAVLAIYAEGPATVRLIQAVRRTPELKPIIRASNERMVAALCAALARLRPDLIPLAIEAASRTAVQCYTYLETLAVDFIDRPIHPLLVAEWKRLARAYFADFLATPPAG